VLTDCSVDERRVYIEGVLDHGAIISGTVPARFRRDPGIVYKACDDGSKVFALVENGGMTAEVLVWSRDPRIDMHDVPVLYSISGPDGLFVFTRNSDWAHVEGYPDPSSFIDFDYALRRLVTARVEREADIKELMLNVEPNHGVRKTPDGPLPLV
jgi:hypothetical protein